MRFVGALLVFGLSLLSQASLATSIDCFTSEMQTFRIDFSPADSTALLITLPLKTNEQPLSLMPLQTDNENELVFFVESDAMAQAFIFTLEAFAQAQETGKMDGVYLYSQNDKHELDQEASMICKKN